MAADDTRQQCVDLVLHFARNEQSLAGISEDREEAMCAQYAADILMRIVERRAGPKKPDY